MLRDEFRVFATIATSLRIFFSDFPVIFLTSVVVLSPGIAMNIYLPEPAISGILNAVLLSILAAVLSVRIVHRINGVRNGLMADIKQALGQKSPFLIVSLLAAFAVLIGLVLFIIPGIIAYVMLLVVIPIACLERLNPRACFQRSIELTKGFRWRIFGVVLVQFGLSACSLAVVTYLYYMQIINDAGVADSVGWQLTFEGLGCLLGSFQAVMITVVYATLRKVKDGVDTNQIAEIFS